VEQTVFHSHISTTRASDYRPGKINQDTIFFGSKIYMIYRIKTEETWNASSSSSASFWRHNLIRRFLNHRGETAPLNDSQVI
jgi:hypothetical protein